MEGLHEIIERRGWTPDDTQNINDYKFFRAACRNERVNEGIIRCLLTCFPVAVSATSEKGWSPLHFACFNKNLTLGIIQLLVDVAPDSVRSLNNRGNMPLHAFSSSASKMNEAAATEMLKLLIKKCPEAVRHANNSGDLPIHLAAKRKSPEFCQVLIEAYTGSEQIPNVSGALPFHIACQYNTVDTVEYLYRLYPDALDHATTEGAYPMHYTISSTKHRDYPATAVDIVRFLLDCDPNEKLKQCHGQSLLRVACGRKYNDSNIEAGIGMIETLYDAHPEAIESTRMAANIQSFHHQVQTFINEELVYARQAEDLRLMMTPDDNGQLPLHTALQNNVRLGSVKLLVKGNPSAIRNVDVNFAMPLHIACEHHDSVDVVQYLLGLLDATTLRAVDIDNNTALHYACRGAKHDSIALLLETYDAASVSKSNADGKLPIDLLWESNAANRGSVEYTGSVFQLLRAFPESLQSAIR